MVSAINDKDMGLPQKQAHRTKVISLLQMDAWEMLPHNWRGIRTPEGRPGKDKPTRKYITIIL